MNPIFPSLNHQLDTIPTCDYYALACLLRSSEPLAACALRDEQLSRLSRARSAHLVAHAERKAWDIKLKATSEVARSVKIFDSFSYGPIWATHEGGPYWRSHVWQGKPETWTANASITREIGAVEEMLCTAMPAPAEVALLYSTVSDVWTVEETNAYGFDRMHTWMALSSTHGEMAFKQATPTMVELSLPLDNNDFLKLTIP